MFGSFMTFFTIFFLLFSIFNSMVMAWGNHGHQIIGYVAEQLISQPTRDKIYQLISQDSNFYVSSSFSKGNQSVLEHVSTWADDIKNQIPWSSVLHYVNTRDNSPHSCSLDVKRDCVDGQCVVGAIGNYTRQLSTYVCTGSMKPITDSNDHVDGEDKSSNQPDSGIDSKKKPKLYRRTLYSGHQSKTFGYTGKKRPGPQNQPTSNPSSTPHSFPSTSVQESLQVDALKFIVHFVGDIVQPLHICGRGRGGNANRIMFDGYRTNLHRVWDTQILKKLIYKEFNGNLYNFKSYLMDQIKKGVFPMDSFVYSLTNMDENGFLTSPTQWAQQTKVLDCNAVWGAYDSNPTQDFGGEYYENTKNIVVSQLAHGALHLASWLELVFSDDSCVQPTGIVDRQSTKEDVPVSDGLLDIDENDQVEDEDYKFLDELSDAESVVLGSVDSSTGASFNFSPSSHQDSKNDETLNPSKFNHVATEPSTKTEIKAKQGSFRRVSQLICRILGYNCN